MNCLIPLGNNHFLEFFIDNILSIKGLLKVVILVVFNGVNYYEN